MENNNEFVSVLICNYNKDEKLVKRCLDSIVNQTYKKIKVIYVDNGSTKLTLSKKDIDLYQLKLDITCFFEPTNKGVAGGYNVALKSVQTDLFCFVDSDDYLDSKCIQRMIEAKEENCSDMVFVRHYLSYPDGKLVPNKFSGETITLSSHDLIKSVLDWNLVYSNHILSEDLGTHWGILYSKAALKNNILRSENNYKIGLFEDFDYVISCLSRVDKVTVLNEILYYLNRGQSSTSSVANPVYKDEILIAEKSFYQNIGYADEETIQAFDVFFFERLHIALNGFENYTQFKERIKQIKQQEYFPWLKKYKVKGIKAKIKKCSLLHKGMILWLLINRG